MPKQLTPILGFALAMLLSFSTLASAMYTTYQAKIIKPDGTPLESTNVNFRFTILDPLGACILYTENFNTINMDGSGGLVYFSLGSGIKTFPTSGTVNFSDVFNNYGTALSCAAGGPPSYSPVSNDLRKIVMQFHDGSGWQTLPAMSINHVPYAMYAKNAASATTAVNSIQLNGKTDLDFVQVTSIPTCSASQALQFNGASFSCVAVGSSGGGGTIASVSASAPIAISGSASAPVISISVASMSSDGYLTAADYAEFKTKLSASSTQIVNTLGYAPVSSSAVAAQIASAAATSNFAGDISGIISNITVNRLQGVSVTVTSLTAGDILQYDGSKYINKNIPTCSGSQYLTFNGTSFSCAADAQANATANGYLSSADWTTFNNKQNATSAAIIATLGYTPANVTSASQWITNASDIYYNTGYVGIGTTDPGLALHIAGVNGLPVTSGTVQTGSFRIGNTVSQRVLDFGINGATSTAWMQSTTKNALSNANTLAINPNGGNVGIGTATPGAMLEIAGQVKITGGAPGAGKILTSDASGLATWETPAAGNSGTVISVTSANGYLSIINTTSAPVITANIGTVSNTLAAGDDARFTDSRSPTGNAGGDLSGTYPNPIVAKINGNAVASTTPVTGQVMRWTGSQYAPVNFSIGHLLSATGAQQFANSSCSASQTLTWSSLTDTFTCANIAGLDAGVITTGTINAARLPAQPFVIGGTFVGVLANSQVLTQFPFPINVTIPANCTNSRFEFLTAATASTTISLQKCTGTGFTSCTQFGTATISASGKVASFTCASATSFTAGTDSLVVLGPATADATAATAGWAIYGTR